MIAAVPTRRDEDRLDWQENQDRGSGCWAAAVLGLVVALGVIWLGIR